jgi:hypothetical protein
MYWTNTPVCAANQLIQLMLARHPKAPSSTAGFATATPLLKSPPEVPLSVSHPTVFASSVSDEAIQKRHCGLGLLRFARNDEAVFARSEATKQSRTHCRLESSLRSQ